MEWTKEQTDIIRSTGNIKINAVAGSGKTTTVIEYARNRPATSRILYLAFNKSVKIEASKKFLEKGITNVRVETAHSLAYKHIVFRNNYRIKPQGYKTNEIVSVLGLQGNGEKHTEYILANHINKFIAYFCNSDKHKVQDLNYLDTIADPIARSFVQQNYKYLLLQTRIFLYKMDQGEIEITHDFYLKKFQLTTPILHFDYILFDEGQDASPAMLDVFFKQKATKVIVGDTHQQIYGWRFAVNSLEKADFKPYNLSTSFRFSQDIANLAIEVLNYKKQLTEHQSLSIRGKGNHKKIKSKAVIARTNLGLLLNAINYVTDTKQVQKIYFEGNINSYTYADEGASLYDVLNLYNGKRHLIKDLLIKGMKDLDELEDYIKKTEDVQLGMMLEIVKEYGNKLPDIIKTIKEKHVEGDAKEKAEMIFSTVHRCKGMEYDSIHLVNDFITEEKLEKLTSDSKTDELNLSKLNEEINLLYVAVTRAKCNIHLPKSLAPNAFTKSPQVLILDETVEKKSKSFLAPSANSNNYKESRKEKSYTLDEVRNTHKGAYLPWTAELDKELISLYENGFQVAALADHFGRTKGAISSRLKKITSS